MFFSDNILTKKGGSLGIVWYVTISAGNDHILDYVCRIAANFRPGVHCLSLSRREYCSVSIGKAWYDRWTFYDCCLTLHEEHTLFGYSEEVMSPRNAMALRLSANLMIGIVRIHSQQTHYTYGTTEPHTLMCINRTFCSWVQACVAEDQEYVWQKQVYKRFTNWLHTVTPCISTLWLICLDFVSHRSDAVTLPDPTTQLSLNTTFPGDNSSFSLESLKVTACQELFTGLVWWLRIDDRCVLNEYCSTTTGNCWDS